MQAKKRSLAPFFEIILFYQFSKLIINVAFYQKSL